uniref:ATP synthase F0 subunit 8 n=1 Tax=Chinaocerus tubulatus TaxID=2479895 RepID=UPI002411457D|nr:ATP synthase F0 subunit 8 [Chinaocerus tubulatus]WEP24826.1 ATP synthase F0 subunit 8 [Chinaocerus tubulatus]
MPQMAPMWWMTMMLIFNLTYLMTTTMLYFNYKIKTKSSIKVNKPELNWKW